MIYSVSRFKAEKTAFVRSNYPEQSEFTNLIVHRDPHRMVVIRSYRHARKAVNMMSAYAVESDRKYLVRLVRFVTNRRILLKIIKMCNMPPRFIKNHMLTEGIVLAFIANDGSYISELPNRFITPEFIEKAVRQSPEAINYLREDLITLRALHAVLSNDPNESYDVVYHRSLLCKIAPNTMNMMMPPNTEHITLNMLRHLFPE